mmetsp:Transcript_56068/g.119369  ORF Transcript_56068/g.119369 Transcript_56068/m.119369 type:complete len:271 (-) Transcript_56068:229-1041(-)
MVVIEMLAGKGVATMAAGGIDVALKMAGTSGSAAAATIFVPPMGPDVPVPAAASLVQSGFSSLTQSGGLLSGLSMSASSFWTAAAKSLGMAAVTVQTFTIPAATVAATTGVWAIYNRKVDELDYDDEVPTVRGINAYLPSLLGMMTLNDGYMAGVLLQSLGQPLHGHLRLFVAGGLALSWPASYLVQVLSKRRANSREAFVLEVALTGAGFLWLLYGSSILSNFPEDVHNAPLLFWSCFVQVAGAWSLLTAGIVAVVVLTVYSLSASKAG